MLIVSSFYKYVHLDNPKNVQKEVFELCNSFGLKGRVLIGHEGINGSVYGTKENVDKFKEKLLENHLFSGIDFKEQMTKKPAFRKLFVRLRKEVVHFGVDVDLDKTASFVTPRELKDMLDNNEDIILLDVRNDYEARVGKFKNAKTVDMKSFRELPKLLHEIENIKEKRIITYCTGGIRCEKASAFLKENGFKDVMQLKGGILAFGKEFPDTYWEGKCFVFDDRLAIKINDLNSEVIGKCDLCGIKCDDLINCRNIACDKLFISCEACREKYNKSCSEECGKSEKRRKEFQLIEN